MSHWLDGPVCGDWNLATVDQYRRVFCELGGAWKTTTLNDLPDNWATFDACNKYPYSDWQWLLAGHDEVFSLRMWPRLATVAMVHSGIQQFDREDASVSDIQRTLGRMAASANALSNELSLLQNAALIWRPPSAPEQLRGTILLDIMKRIMGPWRLFSKSDHAKFFIGPALANFATACEIEAVALGQWERDEVKVGSERNFGLHTLVESFGVLWRATRRTDPSAERLKLDDQNPPFVRAVISVCRMTNTRPPTRSQVVSAIAKVRPTNGWGA